MRARLVLPAALVAMLIVPAGASAFVAHTVLPGESLYSIAAQDGLTVGQLAAANGLPANSWLISGGTVQIPPQGASSTGVAAPASTGVAASGSTGPVCDGDNDSDDVGCGESGAPASAASSSAGGSYVVQPGDTLSAIAARDGVSVGQLAAANGLNPNGVLPSGSVLRVSGAAGSTASPTASAASQPIGTLAQGSADAPPYPTPQTLSGSQIGQIAANQGVPASLADAIAWQESGFNNDAVSSADARGIMQILPGTWAWIQQTLVAGEPPLAPASASDNVRGGALLLRSLLNSSGGNSALAAAGYYQGWSSVQQNGLFPDTQNYVNDVQSLQRQFGGG